MSRESITPRSPGSSKLWRSGYSVLLYMEEATLIPEMKEKKSGKYFKWRVILTGL